jgi:hypothetical protein
MRSLEVAFTRLGNQTHFDSMVVGVETHEDRTFKLAR